jgi:hypothetical protein
MRFHSSPLWSDGLTMSERKRRKKALKSYEDELQAPSLPLAERPGPNSPAAPTPLASSTDDSQALWSWSDPDAAGWAWSDGNPEGPRSTWLSRDASFEADPQVRPTRASSAGKQLGNATAPSRRVDSSTKPFKVLVGGVALVLAIAFFISVEGEIVWIIGKVLTAIAGPLGDPE